MEFLQNISIDQLLLLALGCGFLCVLGVVLVVGLQFVGTLFSLVEVFFNVLSGGPVAWCGCVFLLGACFLCSMLALYLVNLAPTCDENFVGFCNFIPAFLR